MSERPPSPPPRKVEIIVNPVSGVPGRHSRLPRFLDALRAADLEVMVRRTEAPGHATEIAREACAIGDGRVLVAVGGDGTINEVVNGLDCQTTALATYPLGTSSLLARDLELPFDPALAAAAIIRGRRRTLDVGLVNGRRFLMMVGIGWDGHVVASVARMRAGHLGKHRYVLHVLRAVREYRWPELTVRIGENPPRKCHLVFACNIRSYGGFFRIAPDARPDDGLLDFVLIGEGRPRNYLRWALSAFTGTLPRYREVHCVRGRDIEILAAEPTPVQVDGDPAGTTPVRISIEAATLEVLVP